ncbi:unnamed protein product [Amoebophrya sp. A120]|nr:unnamed protein product [Amoebophrya sp. A120]|eukprot:GSA120T00022473001.1
MQHSATKTIGPLAVITGASRGIGRAIVQEILHKQPNTTVLATARDLSYWRESTSFASEEEKTRLHLIEGDLTENSTVKRISQTVAQLLEDSRGWAFQGDISGEEYDEEGNYTADNFSVLTRPRCRLDLLVHSCGTIHPIVRTSNLSTEVDAEKTMDDESETDEFLEEFRDAMNTNFFSAVELTQNLLPFFKENRLIKTSAGRTGLYLRNGTFVADASLSTESSDEGHLKQQQRPLILFMNSAAATFFTTPGWAAYCSTKAALLQYAKVLAMENNHQGIDVLSLAPGLVDTDMQRDIATEGKKLVDSAPNTFEEELQHDKEGKEKNKTVMDKELLENLESLRLRKDMRKPNSVAEICCRNIFFDKTMREKLAEKLKGFLNGELTELVDIEKEVSEIEIADLEMQV